MPSDMDYEFTEEDIQKVINYLSIHDPENADRVYAVQLLQHMQDKAFDVANSGVLTEEEIAEAIKNSPQN
jgi:5-formyltetrahydrofolate cyclo-ligase